MSDRIAVFREGAVEQVATPVELYEAPATSFVAGFVGTSNLLEGTTAERVVGHPGPVSIRPEKIVLTPGRDGRSATAEQCAVSGTVSEVVYLGASTLSVVDLDGSGRLTVVQQNLESSLTHALARRGEPVTLTWHRDHVVPLGKPPTTAAVASVQPSEETR